MKNEFLWSVRNIIPRKNDNFQFRDKELLIYSLFFGVIGFIVSYVFSGYYVAGDQEFYRELYFGIMNYEDVASAFSYYKNTVGASEPGYLLLTFIFANFFDKDLIYAVTNGIFMGVSIFLILRRGSLLFIPILLIFNFYLMTLFFSAERLKIAILVFEFAFLSKSFLRWIFVVGSGFFHFQMIIPIAMYLIWATYRAEKITLKDLLLIIPILSIPIASLFYFSDQFIIYMLEKLAAYSDAGWGGAAALLKPLVFLVFALLYSKESKRLFFAIIPLIFAIYFLGSERFTIFAFALMLFCGAGVRRGLNAPVLLSCSYFAIGGIYFLLEFLENGAVVL